MLKEEELCMYLYNAKLMHKKKRVRMEWYVLQNHELWTHDAKRTVTEATRNVSHSYNISRSGKPTETGHAFVAVEKRGQVPGVKNLLGHAWHWRCRPMLVQAFKHGSDVSWFEISL